MKKGLISLFALISISASAQEWSMEDCMRYAVTHNIKTVRSATDLANARENYTQSIADHFPSISGSANAGSNFGRGIDPETNSYINTATFSNGIGASMSVTVFNGLTMINRTRSAKIAKLKGEFDLQRSSDIVAEETMVAFAEVVYNGELVRLSEQRVEFYKTDLKRMERKTELGTGSHADLAQLAATVASEEYTLISRKNNYDISIIKLKDVMNYPLSDSLAIKPTIDEANIIDPEQDLYEIESEAVKYLPKSLSDKKELELSKINLQIAQGNYAPSISFGAGISTSYYTRLDGKQENVSSYGNQLKNNLGEYLSANLSIPIFSNLSRRTNVHKAKNNYNLAKANYSQAQRTLSSEIKQALLDVQAAQSQHIQAQKNVEAQKLANKSNRRKYEQGLLGIIELQTSDNQLFLAELELRNIYLRLQIKIRQLNYYKGLPYIN